MWESGLPDPFPRVAGAVRQRTVEIDDRGAAQAAHRTRLTCPVVTKKSKAWRFALSFWKSILRKNIKEYAELSENAKRAVRRTIRQGMANGVNESNVAVAARVAAHSGVDISFDLNELVVRDKNGNVILNDDGEILYSDGNYVDGTIYLNPNLSEGRTIESALIHEMAHHIFYMSDVKGRLKRKSKKEIFAM